MGLIRKFKSLFNTTPRQLLAEFDTVKRRSDFFQSIISNILDNPDQILARYAPSDGIGFYRKMESSDPVIASALNTRRAAILNRSWTIITSKAREDVSEYVHELMNNISDLHQTLEQAMGALTTGFVPLEIFWTVRNQRWFIDKIIARDPANYCFDQNRSLRLITKDAPLEGEQVPLLKFAVHTHRASNANPYGESVLKPLYWPVTFSRAGWKWWATAIEKYGMPIITATFPDNASAEDRSIFENFVKSLQSYSWSAVPEGFTVDLHEAKRATGDDYLPFLQYADTKKFQVILGQNLTSEVASHGSRAQAEIHNQVRHDIVLADASNLANTINTQIIKPAVLLNFDSPGAIPKFKITTTPPYDLEKLAKTYDILSAHVDINERFLKEVFEITD